ncbi:NAD(P)-binding domain protein [Cordyceps fumosorosea ARSEF 2679]|uniref:NAD(P)-binding domain protein n=1 Tax=Cordyceps fumosorosea (strain ARSEF 2679) TaxID=1081104 RepID=A0A168BKP8_CORFA|nr:NAD(P)-binding domain protein [Cordyceps fumosorosea ARSEF 2679]OAA70237.1 NAD(P)-binding domain protein [Cordyceps fumosorosea ARSEF 2679]
MRTGRPYDGKLGIITGGSRGIGEATANRLGAKGCNLLLAYTSESSRGPVERIAGDLIAAHGIAVATVQADLHDETGSAAVAILDAARSLSALRFPDRPFQVDILINNAGVLTSQSLNDPALGPIAGATFARVFGVNVLAPLLLMQAVAPYLPRDRSGRVVNVSSVAAAAGFATTSVYAGSKAALEAMTRAWSRELAERATVNAVSAGPVWGQMYLQAGPRAWEGMQPYADATPLAVYHGEEHIRNMAGPDADVFDNTVRGHMGGRRPAFASEVAGVIDMLCSEEAGWSTGGVVCASGGMRMSLAQL